MSKSENVYQRGAERGVSLGLYLTAASLSMVFGDKFPFLSLVSLLLILAIPVVVYRSQERVYREKEGIVAHVELWMHGVMINICGAALCALLTWAVMHYLRPDYMTEMIRNAMSMMEADASLRKTDMYDMMKKAVDNNMVPRDIDYCMQMFWLTGFLGSVGSAISAWILLKNKGR